MADGVEMTLEFASLRTARRMAAKLMPLAAIRPTPKSAPVGRDAPFAIAVVGFTAIFATSVSETVPLDALPMGELKLPIGMLVLSLSADHAAQFTPSAAFLVWETSTMIAS